MGIRARAGYSPARVDGVTRILEDVSRHCDIAERLTLVPPSGLTRGIYFKSIERVLGQAGCSSEYAELFPKKYVAMAWYPASELLTNLVVGAAILKGPMSVHEGMFEIGRLNAVAVAESLLGQLLLRMLSKDPEKLLKQATAARRQSNNVGTWTLSFPEPRCARIDMVEEYFYLESYLLGAGQGTFDAIDMPVEASVLMENKFCGAHILRW